MASTQQHQPAASACKHTDSDSGPTGDLNVNAYKVELWRMADALRGSMDAAEYKHVVLGLIFLKYISDAFEEAPRAARVRTGPGRPTRKIRMNTAVRTSSGSRPRRAGRHCRPRRGQATIGQAVDDAMTAIEGDNPALKDVLPKEYARPALDKTRLGRVVDLVSNIKGGRRRGHAPPTCWATFTSTSLEQFALAEGRKGGEFYTPRRRRAPAGRDAGAVPGPRLRSVLRFVRDVRAVDRVHPGACQRQRQRRQGAGGHLDLRAGVQLHGRGGWRG